MADGGTAAVLRAGVLFLALAAVFAPVAARADAIGPPPVCPAHSEPVFCHGPSTCGPRTCLSSAECVPGEHCAAIGLCIEQHSCGGRTGGDIRDHVFGPCGSGDTCVQGRCSSLFVCTASAGDDASIPPDGSRADANVADAGDGRTHARYGCDCHCSVGAAPRRGPAAWLMAALSLASLGWIKRRSAVRRSQSPGTVSGWLRRE